MPDYLGQTASLWPRPARRVPEGGVGKAAALAESIIRRRPFVDGNKRTAMYAAAYLLEQLGYELEAEQRELEDFAVSIARGTTGSEDIARWFEDHARKR